MRFLLLVICFISIGFGATLGKEHHFIGKINDMKLRDGVLYVAGEGGLLALDNTMQKVFINQTLTGVEKIEFVNVDADSKSELLVSNWLSFALIDDTGIEISRFDTSSSMVSSPLPIDIDNSNGELKIALLERASSYENSDKLTLKKYDSQNEFWKFPDTWQISLEQYMGIPSDGIKFRGGKLYTMQYNNDYSHIYEHNLSNGLILKDFNTTASISIFEVDTQKNLLIVGTNENKIKLYNLNTFELISEYTLSTPPKLIKIFGNYIAVVANNKGWLSDATSNTVYLFEYKDGVFSKLFDFHTQNKVVKSLLFFEEVSGETTLLFGAKTDLYKVNIQGDILQHTNLDNGIYDPYYNSINGIAVGNFGSTNQIVGALDIYATSENNTSRMLYHNGMLINKLQFVNIDSDDAMEMWTSDWYRTYVYDENKTLLFILPYGATAVKAIDINTDGINELVVLGNEKLRGYNGFGELVFTLNTTDRLLHFDIKDIDGDTVQDIAYIAYSDNGNRIKIVNDANATIKYEVKVQQPATNIHLFEYIFNPIDGGYSLLFNIGGSYRLDINEEMGDYGEKYIGDNKFVDGYFTTAIVANMDDDPEVELIRATNSAISVYDIFFKNFDSQGYAITTPIKNIAINIGGNNLRGIALFDGDIVVAADNILALYSFDGTKKWEYSAQIDTQNLEDNHFTHIKPIYATNGNHKIFVGGYSLYEFDKNGNFISKIKGSKRYMVTSSGNYANPFDINTDGNLALGQMGIFSINSNILVPPPSVEMILNQGWNLVSLPIDTSVTSLGDSFPNARFIWKYSTGTWKFFSSDGALRSLAQSQGHTLFSEIQSGEGFWVYNTQNELLHFNGNSYDITQKAIFTTTNSPWSLLGIGGNPKHPEAILNAKLNAKLIWNFTDEWKIYTNDPVIYHQLEGSSIPFIEILPRGKGFWLHQ